MPATDVHHRTGLRAEFDRQVDVLIERNYPKVAGMKPADFMKNLSPLRETLRGVEIAAASPEDGRIPLGLVIKSELVAAAKAIELVERRDKPGFSVMDPDEIASFEPIEAVRLPEGLAYLMMDVDTGRDTLNVTPDAALEVIESRRRSPLTIDEGVALITHYPEAVAKNGGFSLLGSRCGDRRVTALWISQSRPKLGWCWAGNPHTWLGSASCGGRLGP